MRPLKLSLDQAGLSAPSWQPCSPQFRSREDQRLPRGVHHQPRILSTPLEPPHLEPVVNQESQNLHSSPNYAGC